MKIISYDFNYEWLGRCQYPVQNVGALVLGPEPEIACEEPAIVKVAWKAHDDEAVPEESMLCCTAHFRVVLETEGEAIPAEVAE